MEIFRDNRVFVEVEESEIPWLKIFSIEPYREFTDCDPETRQAILEALDVIEREMRDYFKPDKINIASFGNYLPHVHFHVMARFQKDSFFPEPMWGKKQRNGELDLPDFQSFYDVVKERLLGKKEA